MKRKIRFGAGLFACILFLMSTPISAVSDSVFNWYCVRNREHKQPSADANMQFIDRYHGYYVDKAHGDNSDDKVVYLTFDAGYENGNVEKILDTMKQENVTGAFFILGNLIEKNPDLVKRMADEGHMVCNHTTKHRDMTKIDTIEEFKKEVTELEMLYRNTTGYEMAKFYRPPEGRFDERSMAFADQLGYKTIFWSFAYADWDNQNQPSPEFAKQKIMDYLHNGAIILLHPTSSTNAQILKEVIRDIKAQGYRFGSLDELIQQ